MSKQDPNKNSKEREKLTVKIFSSFEEAELSEIQAILKQDPIERLRETVELILRVYGVSREELKTWPPFKRITFTKIS
ncbi:MAG TPA: hypothetical protein VK590_03860 [Saprospiraceae bacterium]|nr:hypothetical protein [Saprospiraceae bacterium]